MNHSEKKYHFKMRPSVKLYIAYYPQWPYMNHPSALLVVNSDFAAVNYALLWSRRSFMAGSRHKTRSILTTRQSYCLCSSRRRNPYEREYAHFLERELAFVLKATSSRYCRYLSCQGTIKEMAKSIERLVPFIRFPVNLRWQMCSACNATRLEA